MHCYAWNTEQPHRYGLSPSNKDLDVAALVHPGLEGGQRLGGCHFAHQGQVGKLRAPLALHLPRGEIKCRVVGWADNATVLNLQVQAQ
jgi:hypothetical protein